MIRDAENELSGAQALTATIVSTNVYDSRLDRDLGIGEPMCLLLVLRTVADATDGNETYTAQLQSDDNLAFSSPLSVGPVITITRGTVAGTKFVMPIPPDATGERYYRLSYTLGGTTPSVTVDAHIVPQSAIQNDAYYTDAVTIG